jgi:hypothetical protein
LLNLLLLNTQIFIKNIPAPKVNLKENEKEIYLTIAILIFIQVAAFFLYCNNLSGVYTITN